MTNKFDFQEAVSEKPFELVLTKAELMKALTNADGAVMAFNSHEELRAQIKRLKEEFPVDLKRALNVGPLNELKDRLNVVWQKHFGEEWK